MLQQSKAAEQQCETKKLQHDQEHFNQMNLFIDLVKSGVCPEDLQLDGTQGLDPEAKYAATEQFTVNKYDFDNYGWGLVLPEPVLTRMIESTRFQTDHLPIRLQTANLPKRSKMSG